MNAQKDNLVNLSDSNSVSFYQEKIEWEKKELKDLFLLLLDEYKDLFLILLKFAKIDNTERLESDIKSFTDNWSYIDSGRAFEYYLRHSKGKKILIGGSCMNKFQLSTIEEDILNDLDNPLAWMDFLKKSSWHYKHSFYNQLLIACQRDDATAVTTMKAWNTKLNRYVNTGANRILILENTGNSREFVNVFDVSDTHINKKDGYQFKLWERNTQKDQQLLKHLDPNNSEIISLSDYFFSKINAIIEENRDDLNSEISYHGNSDFHHLDTEETIQFIRNSIIFQVLERCGESGLDYFSISDFDAIKNIKNFKAFTLIGSNVNDAVKPLLIEIGKAVIDIEKGEKSHEQIIQIGQSDIFAGRRFHESEHRTADTTESANREVRNAERSIPGGTQSSAIDSIDLLRSDQQTSGRSGSNSEAQTGADHGRDAQNESSTGSEYQTIGMGGLHENDRETSGGNRTERDRIYPVTSTGQDTQIDLFSFAKNKKAESAENAPSAFSIKDEIIDRILQSGTNDRNSDLRIAYQFSCDSSEKQDCLFLQSLYGTGAKGLIIDGTRYSTYWDNQGIHIGQGDTFNSNFLAITLTWVEVRDRIKFLADTDRFLTKDRTKQYIDHEINLIATDAIYLYRDLMPRGQKILSLIDFKSSVPDAEDSLSRKIYDSHTSDKQFISDFITELGTLNQAIDTDPSIVRWNRMRYAGDRLADRLNRLVAYHQSYDSIYNKLPKAERFITQDEIDLILLRGSNVEDSKYRIYKYFTDNSHNLNDKIAFLKNEYGTGGTSAMDKIDAWHDAKGIKLEWHLSDDDWSIKDKDKDPDIFKILSWSVVSNRIDELIENGQYNLKGYFGSTMLEDILINETPHPDLKQAINATLNDKSLDHDEKVAMIMALYKINGNSFKPENVEFDQEYSNDGIHFIRKDNPEEKHFRSWYSIMRQINRLISWQNRYFPATFNEQTVQAGTEIQTESAGEDLEKEKLKLVNETEVEENIQEHKVIEKETPVDTSEPEKQPNVINTADLWDFNLDRFLLDLKSPTHVALRKDILEYYNANAPSRKDFGFYLRGMYRNSVLHEFDQFTLNYTDVGVSLPSSIQDEYPTFYTWMEIGHRIKELVADGIYEDVQIGDRFEINGQLHEVIDTDANFNMITLDDISSSMTSRITIDRNDLFSIAKRIAPISINKNIVQINSGNYRLHGTDQQPHSQRENFKYNIKAIETLNLIEMEGRFATPEEQEILSKYVGWGGLAQAFDDKNIHWKPEYEKLKNLLSESEYQKARESTLNAHYTSSTIIKGMYEALNNMGFRSGNVLEPAMGVGHFFGLLPEAMKDSKLYGVEIDSLTSRIAKQLYPETSIFEGGFEKTNYSNNFFDVAVGNVPFGDYRVYDKEYQKENFLIHDYFFAKTLDKLRPDGVMAMITSKGTMDKKSPVFRQYMAKRAELLGAVRLPNNAFNHAGTEVTSDILFFKKRDRMTLGDEDWVHLETDDNGIPMNSYFVEHPEMIIGEMGIVSGRYGEETACLPVEGIDLGQELKKALENITYHFSEDSIENALDDDENDVLPADPNVENYSYTLVDDQIYFRNNSVMRRISLPEKTENRVRGMIDIRDCVRDLLQAQLQDESNEVIEIKQGKLSRLYDRFIKENNHINTRGNKLAFEEDSAYWLLCALEKIDDDGNYLGKSDIFTQRTISPIQVAESVDTANEALIVSIGEKARIDLPYMEKLCGKSQDQITEELKGVIFHDPIMDRWVTADEYLSGNVRNKLAQAKEYASQNEMYEINVTHLEAAQPKELEASEIEVNLGATWIDQEYIDQFILDTFKPAAHLIHNEQIKTHYSPNNGSWNIEGKSMDSFSNVLINATYGTKRANAYRILESALNLKNMRIMDRISTPDGDRSVLNSEETILANQKQELIKEAFKDWIFKDQERRNTLVEKYNHLFNSTKPREFDGQHIVMHGVSPEIRLRDYQKNAIARALYGGNTLLGHCVGAGKTFEMTGIAMESKYLGLCNKSMFVVPNHLVGQWGSEFLALYPGANILVAQKKDFTPGNRKKFCSRIATGNYDAVIIGHSQFERIPLSKEFQADMINQQIDNVLYAINEAVEGNSEQFTIKQLEKTRKNLVARLEKLNDTDKDNTVTFEELGIDRLFVDEAHSYKNLFLYTKMRNVAGIGQSEAQKSTDMFNKCRYLDELTGSKGVIFATGTPISNSISELYTMMRYLQFERLQESGLGHFDSWASNFTQQVTAVELAPEGNGYRSKTRLARFYNLPELMSFFKETADIQTPDMLNLPIPKATYIDEKIKPSEFQKGMLDDLVDRAERVRNRSVEPYEDNMLKISNDGRKLALDQRLINPLLPDSDDSKANRCVDNAFNVWQDTHENKSTQLIFCDLSTPNGNSEFNVYDDIKNKLILKGVPENEIAFIHDANTDAKKVALFGKVRSGQVRFLLGSTPMLGAGTNVQDRLIALHHMDVPWKPADIEQQEGRILRQGNMNPEVKIFRYITEQTFDAYSWQLIENKQKFIGQIMTSKSPSRSCEDVDEQALSYAEVKALATGNPLIKEKMDLDIKVTKLKLLKANHTSQLYRMEDNIAKVYPQTISNTTDLKQNLLLDQESLKCNHDPENFTMKIDDKFYADKKEAGQAIIENIKTLKSNRLKKLGEYSGFNMYIETKGFDGIYLVLKNNAKHTVELGKDPIGNITRINNVLQNIPDRIKHCDQEITDTQNRLETAKEEVLKPFAQEDELSECLIRLKELDILLSADQPTNGNENETEEIAEWEELEA